MGVVVIFVEVFENGGEDFRFFFGEGYFFILCIDEVFMISSFKERCLMKNIFMCCKELIFMING